MADFELSPADDLVLGYLAQTGEFCRIAADPNE
jgi:hypothetical protein